MKSQSISCPGFNHYLFLSVQNIRNSRQSFQNSPSVRAQLTVNAYDVCLVYKRERDQNEAYAALIFFFLILIFSLSAPERSSGSPSNSVNLTGKSLR